MARRSPRSPDDHGYYRPGRWQGLADCAGPSHWIRCTRLIFIDAVNVKIREGQARQSGPSTWPWASPWTASGTCWRLWAGGARRRRGGQVAALRVLTEINEPTASRDVCMLVCDAAQGPARRGERGVGEDHRANVYRPSAAELVQIRVEERDWAHGRKGP